MTLFDFSKAYDRVWRTGLLQKMHLLGIPPRFLVWIGAWLTNRQARVRVNAKVGRARTFKEGLPQGSVLSPLLFVIYINDFLMQFEDTTLVSAYADDLAIACSGRSKIDMTKKLQKEVDKVVKWSDDARLTLNTNKCEVSIFSLCTAEASWKPHITIRGLPLSFNAAPTFLGVQYDRQLTFSEHAKKVYQAMTKKTNIFPALGGTTWRWRPAELRTIYIAIQRSLAEYGSQAWAPWLPKSNLRKLESAQLNAARAITGHLRSTSYTDGSTTDGTRNGGAGMIIARYKKVLHRWHAPTGALSSAYLAEKAALEAALKWLESENDWPKAVIVCDCKSPVEATGNPRQADQTIDTLQRSIATIICSKRLLINWVFKNCNLWGNELADLEVKRGSTLPQPAERHLDRKTRKAGIHREDRPFPSSHPRLLDLYTTNTKSQKGPLTRQN